jgi:GT2 family glycosyltransferase
MVRAMASYAGIIPPLVPDIGRVPAVLDMSHRPLWSVMIPTYNCGKYLRETLESVLAQDPGPEIMQIEVVDDASTADDPDAVVAEVGRGRVAFHRLSVNGGHVRTFNTCLARARGHLIHVLHGDDAVRPGFYEAIAPAFERAPQIGAAFCRVIVMDEEGHWKFLKPLMQRRPGPLQDQIRRLAVDQPIQTPSMVVKRSTYERVGGFDRRFQACGEDVEMWLRIAAHYPVWYEPTPLALYRTHRRSLSGNASRTGGNIVETRAAVESIRYHLSGEDRDEIIAASMRRIAFWGLQLSREAIAEREFRAAARQAREALRCNSSPEVLLRATKIVLYGLARQLRPAVRALRTPLRSIRASRAA